MSDSKPIDTGGAAYPGPSDYMQDGSPVWMGEIGMTLRDHFAGLAMQGNIRNQAWSPSDYANVTAQESYKMADAMIAARKEQS